MKSNKFKIKLVAALVFGTVILSHAQNKDWKAMEPYLGFWESEMKKGRNGKEFYFTYDLKYFDEAKTIVKMVITQKFKEGNDNLLWEGYKGWDPIEKEVYYYGFSPMGRIGIGKGFIRDGKYFWEYYGASVDGNKVDIIDEFTPVENGVFTSITKLKMEGQDWRKINEDTWTKKK